MHLSQNDVQLFYHLLASLMTFVNQELTIIDGIESVDDFIGLTTPEERYEVHTALYENVGLFDKFIQKNPNQLSEEELQIVESWKQFKNDAFYIYRHLKKYTILLNSDDGETKAYGVSGISEPIKEMFPYLPILARVTLLPFKDKIIFDGLMSAYSVSFGSGIRNSLKDSYNQAKAKYGIITQLSYAPPKEQSEKELLKYYLKNKTNREFYQIEIEELVNKSEELHTFYQQEIGKVHARTIKKQLRSFGIVQGYFAVLGNNIIASGLTKEKVQEAVQVIVPEDKIEWLHTFQMKARNKK